MTPLSEECPQAVKDQSISSQATGRYMALFKVVLCTWGKIVGEAVRVAIFASEIRLQEREERPVDHYFHEMDRREYISNSRAEMIFVDLQLEADRHQEPYARQDKP